MAENEQIEEPIRTAQDLEMEALRAEISEIKQQLGGRIAELVDANKGLWAELHRAPEAPAAEPAPEPPATPTASDPDAMLNAFNAEMGISKE